MARCPLCHVLHTPKCRPTRGFRWPAAPLLEVVGTHTAATRKLGVSGTEIARADREGLTDRQADHWASKLGLHPSMIWPEWDRVGLTVTDDVFVNRGGWRHAWEWSNTRTRSAMISAGPGAALTARRTLTTTDHLVGRGQHDG